MKTLSYLVFFLLLSGCVSAVVEYRGLVEVIKYPSGKEAKLTSKYAPTNSGHTQDDESRIGLVQVHYAHYTGYLKNQIRDEAYKKMYEICDKRYEILKSKKLSERVYQAHYSSRYNNGTGGASGSAGDVLLTGELIAFRCS